VSMSPCKHPSIVALISNGCLQCVGGGGERGTSKREQTPERHAV
jgi:hypothetical protein